MKGYSAVAQQTERPSHFLVPEGSVPRNQVAWPAPPRPRAAAVAAAAAKNTEGEGEGGGSRTTQGLETPGSRDATFVDFRGTAASAGSSLAQLLAEDSASLSRQATRQANGEEATGGKAPYNLTAAGLASARESRLSGLLGIAEALPSPGAPAPSPGAPPLSPGGLSSRGSPPGLESHKLFSPEVPELLEGNSDGNASPVLARTGARDSSVREAPPERSAQSSPRETPTKVS
jgi:hypothetical protein